MAVSVCSVDVDGTPNGANFVNVTTIDEVIGLDASTLEVNGVLNPEIV